MAHDYISMDGRPIDEENSIDVDKTCDYLQGMYDECNAFCQAIVRKFGPPPFGARLKVASNSHDFGTYYDVRVYFNDEIEDAIDYAFMVENEGVQTWDEVGMIATYGNTNGTLTFSARIDPTFEVHSPLPGWSLLEHRLRKAEAKNRAT